MIERSRDRSNALARHDARARHQVHVAGAGAEEAHLRVLGHLPQHVRRRVSRAAVEQHRADAQQQRADQEIPHHPAGGGEEEHPVARPQVHVQALQLELFQQDPAVPVHDRLGQAGGAGGEQDPQRVVERHLLEPETGGRDRRMVEGGRPAHRPRDRRLQPSRLQVGQVDDVLEAVQGVDDLAQLGGAREVGTRVPVAVRAEQDLRGQLAEPVDHPAPAEVRRAAGPDGADAGGGEHGDDRVRDVRQAGHHPVAGAHAQPAQLGGQHPHLAGQIAPRTARPARCARCGTAGRRRPGARCAARARRSSAGPRGTIRRRASCAVPARRWAAPTPGPRTCPTRPARKRPGHRPTTATAPRNRGSAAHAHGPASW